MTAQARTRAFKQIIHGELRQVPQELAAAYAVVAGLRPGIFVEIGSAWGGSLYVYAGACAPGYQVFSIDTGKREASLRRTLDAIFRGEPCSTRLIKGNSHLPEALDALRAMLAGHQIDFLHIDGDHSTAGMLQDWTDYWPLVRPGGLAAVHDIFHVRCGVPRAWAQIKVQEASYCELKGPPWRNKGHIGIGLVWKGDAA